MPAKDSLIKEGGDLLSHRRSTIGAGGLNFSVRNGKRWGPAAIATRMGRQDGKKGGRGDPDRGHPRAHAQAERVRAISKARLRRHRPYTCLLSTSSSLTTLSGDLILRTASRLDAFSAYPGRTWIPGGAPGGTTGRPAVRPAVVGGGRGETFKVVIAAGSHLFPFRTEKLSPPAPMVLQCNAGE